MTIDWHPEPGTVTWLQYRKQGDRKWATEMGEKVSVPGIPRFFQRLELTGLHSDQLYEFRFSDQDPIYTFRTMPANLTRPIRFVASGDMLHRAVWMRNTAKSVMRTAHKDLDFAVIGGDLAYADGEARKVGRWYDYFRIWSEEMITSENRVIPHVAVIGNHEVKEYYIYNYPSWKYSNPDFAMEEAPYFSTFIPFPGADGYGVLDFGDYLSLFLLDSGHITHVEGEQTNWLEHRLHERAHVRHLVPVYHVAAWPSARPFDGFLQTLVRNYWVPLFERYGVRLAFENHDHTYKRTHPIRNGQIDETGVYYIGDGAWGVRTRQIFTDDEGSQPWYLAHADTLRHFVLVEIYGDDIQLEIFDEDARKIDELNISTGRTSRRMD